MSGFELAVGVLGVTQFGAEAIALSFKFKKLWGEVKGASEEVDDLLDNITDASYVIQEIENQVAQSSLVPAPLGNAGFKRILDKAQKAHKSLEEAVQILHGELESSNRKSRRFISSAKVVLKKPVLDRLETKLRRSMQQLYWATQLHSM